MAEIDTVINDAKEYAGELLDDARDIINDASRISQGRAYVNVQEIDWETDANTDANVAFNDVDPVAEFSDSYIAPDSSGITDIEFQPNYLPNVPIMPGAPNALDTSSLFRVNIPDWNLADFTDSPPNIDTSPAIPLAPALNLPETPGGSENPIEVPDVVVPTFDDNLDVTAPTEIDVTDRIASEFQVTREQLAQAADDYATSWLDRYCPEYRTGLNDIETALSRAITSAGDVGEGWDDAIYDKAKIRVNDEQQFGQAALTADYARRGFALPPGAVMAGLSRLRHEGARNLADTSGTIAAERIKIEVQHLQFALQISSQVRMHFASAMQGYMQILMSANATALQYAAEIGKWAVDIFNQRVQIYELEVKRYQSEAQVYTVRLESAFAYIRQIEVEIEAEKLAIDLDRNQIALYEAQIRGEQSKIDIYNSELQGVRLLLETESQKIQVYESQVRAYAARVGAKESEYGAYRAAIQGDAARVDAYQAEIQAYSSAVDAEGTKVSAEAAISRSITDYNNSLISQRDSTIKKYIAEIQGESTRFDSSVDIQKVALARYTTDIESRLRLVAVTYDKDRLELRAAIARVETNLDAQRTNVNGYIRSIVSQADITNSGGNIIANMASSALTTNNTVLTQEE